MKYQGHLLQQRKEDAACTSVCVCVCDSLCVCVCAPSGRKINSYFMQTHSEGKKVEAT